MYSMKEACSLTDMTYENLKFYCNEGLVPNVKRDSRNYRVFDEHDIKWIQSLNCLKSCGMSLAEMKTYLALCMEGEGTIPERKVILAKKKEDLLQSIAQLQKAVAFIDWKQGFYDDVLSGKTEYYSNLVPELMKEYTKLSTSDLSVCFYFFRILIMTIHATITTAATIPATHAGDTVDVTKIAVGPSAPPMMPME